MGEYKVNYRRELDLMKRSAKSYTRTMNQVTKDVMGFGAMPQIMGMWTQDHRNWTQVLEAMHWELDKDSPDPQTMLDLHREAVRLKALNHSWSVGAKNVRTATLPRVRAWKEECDRRDAERKAAMEERRRKRASSQ